MYFGFSRRESRGFLLVFPFLLSLFLVPVIYDRMLKFTNQDAYKMYLKEVDQMIARQPELSGNGNPGSGWNGRNQDTVVRVQIYKKVAEPRLNAVSFSDADSIILQVVPGIGEVLAGRIIKYRESLGGFHSQNQLLEVYGITEEVAGKVFEYFPFSPDIRQKIRINNLEASALAEHPYIDFGHAKVIVAFRKQHGNYTNADDLLKIKIFNEAWLERLRPYLEF